MLGYLNFRNNFYPVQDMLKVDDTSSSIQSIFDTKNFQLTEVINKFSSNKYITIEQKYIAEKRKQQ